MRMVLTLVGAAVLGYLVALGIRAYLSARQNERSGGK